MAVSIGCYEIRSTFKTYENGSCEWKELSELVRNEIIQFILLFLFCILNFNQLYLLLLWKKLLYIYVLLLHGLTLFNIILT